jgi:hypothetical protein
LLEFIIIIAALGNAIGLSVSLLLPERNDHEANWAAIVTHIILEIFWIFGGSTWALWIATQRREERTWARLGLLAMGILAPPAFLSVFICPIALIAVREFSSVTLLLMFWLFVSIPILIVVFRLEAETRRLAKLQAAKRDARPKRPD